MASYDLLCDDPAHASRSGLPGWVATLGVRLTFPDGVTPPSTAFAGYRCQACATATDTLLPYEAVAQAVGTTSGPTTTSASFVTVPEMSRTFRAVGGSVLVHFSGNFNVLSGDQLELALFYDGAELAGTRRQLQYTSASGVLGLVAGSVGASHVALHGVVPHATDGNHTVEARWRRLAGAARAVSTYRTLTIVQGPS